MLALNFPRNQHLQRPRHLHSLYPQRCLPVGLKGSQKKQRKVGKLLNDHHGKQNLNSTRLSPSNRRSYCLTAKYYQNNEAMEDIWAANKYPNPSTLPPLETPYFHHEIIHESTKSRARVGRIHVRVSHEV